MNLAATLKRWRRQHDDSTMDAEIDAFLTELRRFDLRFYVARDGYIRQRGKVQRCPLCALANAIDPTFTYTEDAMSATVLIRREAKILMTWKHQERITSAADQPLAWLSPRVQTIRRGLLPLCRRPA